MSDKISLTAKQIKIFIKENYIKLQRWFKAILFLDLRIGMVLGYLPAHSLPRGKQQQASCNY